MLHNHEDSLVIGDHCSEGTQLVHLQYYVGYVTVSPLTPHVSHVSVEVRWALNYVRALAVRWCHEPGYHRKSETSGPSWPFIFMNKTWSELATFERLWSVAIQTLPTLLRRKTRGYQRITHNSNSNSSCIVLMLLSFMFSFSWKTTKSDWIFYIFFYLYIILFLHNRFNSTNFFKTLYWADF